MEGGAGWDEEEERAGYRERDWDKEGEESVKEGERGIVREELRRDSKKRRKKREESKRRWGRKDSRGKEVLIKERKGRKHSQREERKRKKILFHQKLC